MQHETKNASQDILLFFGIMILCALIQFAFTPLVNEYETPPPSPSPTKEVLLYEKPLIDAPIHLSFVGDVMMDWSIKEAIGKHGAAYPFLHVRQEISSSDVSIANLETAVTTRGTPEPKQFTFRSSPDSLHGLVDAGFDLVSLANNHSLDYGTEGLLDTFSHLKKSGLSYIGAGRNEKEAYRAHRRTVKGKKMSFLSFSHVLPSGSWYAGSDTAGIASGYQQDRVLERIEEEKRVADIVLVYMHWGEERVNRPSAYLQQYAKDMIDAGADAVIGSHPHVLQGFDTYKGKPIAYSLGNFLFPDYVSGASAETGILHLTFFKGVVSMRFSPYLIGQNEVVPVSPAKQKDMLTYLDAISFGVQVDKDGQIVEK